MEPKIAKVHPNGQISLGRQWGGRDVRIEYVSPTEIRIVAGTFVPAKHASYFSPEALQRLDEFDDWAAENPAVKTDLRELRRDIAARKTKKAGKAVKSR